MPGAPSSAPSSAPSPASSSAPPAGGSSSSGANPAKVTPSGNQSAAEAENQRALDLADEIGQNLDSGGQEDTEEKKKKACWLACCIGILLINFGFILIVFSLVGFFKGSGFGLSWVTGNSPTNNTTNQVDCAGLSMPGLTAERYAWVKDAAAKYMKGDEAALIALIKIESGWRADAKNPGSSAAGLGQFTTGTAGAYKQFIGGTAPAGDSWSAGILYDMPASHPDDARFDAKRSIYATAQKFGGHIKVMGNPKDAYVEGYHSYCRDLSKTSCQKQKAEAIAGGNRLQTVYDQIRNNGCKVIASAPNTGTTPITPGSGPCCGVVAVNLKYITFSSRHSTPYLMPQAADALYKASEQFYEQTKGRKLPIESMWRTNADQTYMWNTCQIAKQQKKKCIYDNPAAPGTSPHESALAIDVSLAQLCGGCKPCPLYTTLRNVLGANGWSISSKIQLCDSEDHHFNYSPCLSKYGSSSAAIPAANGKSCKK